MDRFENTGYLEIKDHKTGLIWSSEYIANATWEKAKEFAASLGADWRLPKIEELITLSDFGKIDPASSFPEMPSAFFWSSSSYVLNDLHAWGVNFYYGYVGYTDKCNTYYARCVRGRSE